MKKRFITAIVMAIVFIPLIILPKLIIPFQILMTFGVIIGSLEMLKMFNKEKELSLGVKIITVLSTLAVYLSVAWYTNKVGVENISSYIGSKFVLAALLVTFVSLSLLVWDNDYDGRDVGKVLTIAFYIGLGAGSIVVLRVAGLSYIAFLFLTTVSTDVFAYLVGVKFGKHKMAPSISPKKSWEGAIAGTFIATILAGTFALLYGKIFKSGIFNPHEYETLLDGIGILKDFNMVGKALIIYPLTALLSSVGQIGDLVASKFKRTYDIKDFGNVFPGHGGVMDRFDSSFFASMFLLIFLLLFQL